MEVRRGYKRTEVGVIPEEWDVQCMSILITSGPKNGYSGRSAKEARGTPTLSLGATTSGSLILNDETVKRLEETIDVKSDLFLKSDDVLIQRSNTIDLVGTTAVFDGPSNVYVYPDLMMRVRFREKATAHWFWRYANSSDGRRFFMSVAAGSSASMPKISGEKLRRMELPFPPLPEQRAIAAALSDVDALLGGLERLISKKRDLKQAAMQQLLTGQTRLPGFHGEWGMRRLGEIASIRNQKVMPADVAPDTPCVELEHIGQGDGSLMLHSTARFSTSSKHRFFIGDVLFGRLRSYLRKYWLADRAGICTTEIWPLMVDPDQAVGGFLLAVVQSDRFIETASMSYGTHMPRADWGVVRNFEIHCPQVDEQTAIAAVLSDMDAELSALEARRDKTRALKQGMMQELLTGRIRLVAASSNVVPVDFASIQKHAPSYPKSHNWQFNEAVVVAMLVKQFGSDQYPLGRKRCTKLGYLMHRHVERAAQGYLKKAAGPYNPAIKYKGPETIAQKNGYIRPHTNGKFSGFVAAGKIAEAEGYFDKWYGREVLAWLEQFRHQTNDELELLATVDMAIVDMKRVQAEADVAAVKSIILDHPEWETKLEREIFADANIARAIGRVTELFAE